MHCVGTFMICLAAQGVVQVVSSWVDSRLRSKTCGLEPILALRQGKYEALADTRTVHGSEPTAVLSAIGFSNKPFG